MDEKQIIQEQIQGLLAKLGMESKMEIKAEDESYSVVLNADDNALLIGKHGNTLASLEHIIALMVAHQLGEFKRIVLEVGDYRKEREEYLDDLSARLSEEVVSSGHDKTIRGLKPWERRYIHMLLAENEEVETQSEGEGRERVLVIKKK